MHTAELPLASIPEGSLTRVEREGSSLVVIRSQGRLYAYRDSCPHAFWPLSEGTLRDEILECPGHGWEFDVATGECLGTPGYCLSRVQVSVRGDAVVLEWSDTDRSAGTRCRQPNEGPSAELTKRSCL
jgi:toluene monooxygenase system ferredoxin subunit